MAFADLVGFTRLGEMVPPEELVELAERLAVLGREIAVPPVRFIKTIGDAVMFVCPEPAPLVEAVLRLVEEAQADDTLPRLRAGIASGEAVSRVGDWFGSPVNTASRITGAARPGTVLVAEPVRVALADSDDFRWSFAGGRRLKGHQGRGESVSGAQQHRTLTGGAVTPVTNGPWRGPGRAASLEAADPVGGG